MANIFFEEVRLLIKYKGTFWTDLQHLSSLDRSIITQYKHKDLFHVELMMYSDVPPTK